MAAKRTSKNRTRGRSGVPSARSRRTVREKPRGPQARLPPVSGKAAADPPLEPRRQVFEALHFAASPYLPFSREIPSLYNEPYVRIMPRDPGHLFAFWEQGPAPAPKAGAAVAPAAQPSHQVLRVYEIVHSRRGEQARRFIGDIPLEKNMHSQYIQVPRSGGSYQVELGECDQAGRYIALVASNNTRMPDARMHEPARNLPFRADDQKLIELSARSATVGPAASGAAADKDILSARPEAAPAGGSHFMPHPGSADNPLSNSNGLQQ